MENFLKIELDNETMNPSLSLAYDSIDNFQELVMTLFSPISSDNLYFVIRDILAKNNASSEDITWFDNFYQTCQIIKNTEDYKIVMTPSSFR